MAPRTNIVERQRLVEYGVLHVTCEAPETAGATYLVQHTNVKRRVRMEESTRLT